MSRLIVFYALALTMLTVVSGHGVALAENESFWHSSDSKYERKINDIGQRILKANDIKESIAFQLSYRTMGEKTNINASANSDYGFIRVENGLLRYIASDDELAAIISHEIAHVLKHHTRRMRLGMIASTVLVRAPVLVGSALLTAGSPLSIAAAGYSGRAVDTKLSRINELEADALGLQLLIKAGYDPEALPRILHKIGGDGSAIDLWRTHPRSTERVTALRQQLAKQFPATATNTAPAPTATAPLQALSSQDASSGTLPLATPVVPAVGITVSGHPDL